MGGFHIAVIPVGKVEAGEVEAALSRVSKALRVPVELKGALPVPKGVEDPTRGQFRASRVMDRLRAMVPQLGPGKLIGGDGGADEKPPPIVDAYIFVTDVDLFTEKSDGVFAALLSAKKTAVVSVRRLREAFYRRKADPTKQRTRLVKELSRMAARLQGAPGCSDPQCVLAPSKMFADLDLKQERFCRDCSRRLFEGRIRI
jgi:predicted Zn-dependent protease